MGKNKKTEGSLEGRRKYISKWCMIAVAETQKTVTLFAQLYKCTKAIKFFSLNGLYGLPVIFQSGYLFFFFKEVLWWFWCTDELLKIVVSNPCHSERSLWVGRSNLTWEMIANTALQTSGGRRLNAPRLSTWLSFYLKSSPNTFTQRQIIKSRASACLMVERYEPAS